MTNLSSALLLKKISTFTAPSYFVSALLRSWWVVLFLLICYMSYERNWHQWKDEFSKLKMKLEIMKEKRNQALLLQEDLLLQINSQSDPEWVELTLMRVLGLVPEGQSKVYFTHKIN